MPALKPESREARRNAILDAAMRCFARDGYRGTSMRDICQEAGVSIGGIYVHFDSKEDILAGLAEQFREEREDIHANIAKGPDASSAIARVLEAMTLDYDTEEGAFALHADVVMLGEALSVPILKSVMVDTDREHFASFKALIGEGAFEDIGEADGVAQFITGSLFGLIILSAYHEGFDRQRYITILRNLLNKAESNSGRDIGSNSEGEVK